MSDKSPHVLVAKPYIEQLQSELAALLTKLEEVRGILAGPDAGSLPNDYPLDRMATDRMEERNKFMWQVRDTCTRAEEAERKLAEAHPTTEECEAMGRNGGLPDTPEERTRFEAYMRGHSWEPGPYDGKKGCYWETVPRMLYGVWRDRGALCGSRAQARADGMDVDNAL